MCSFLGVRHVRALEEVMEAVISPMRAMEEPLLPDNTLLLCVHTASGWQVSPLAVLVRVRGGGLGLSVRCVPVSGSRGICESERVCICVWLCTGLGCLCSRVAAQRCLTARTKASTDRQVAWKADLPQESSKGLSALEQDSRQGWGLVRGRWSGASGFPYPRLVLTQLGA